MVKYNLKGEYGIGYTYNNKEFYFDLEDYEKIKDYKWCINKNRVEAISYKEKPRKHISFHRLILNLTNPKIVCDHINGIAYDNRKINLRICTQEQNRKNSKIYKNNTSGYKGVYWSKKDKKWIAFIGNGKGGHRIILGYFNDINEAVTARKKAEIEYFGDFRRKN